MLFGNFPPFDLPCYRHMTVHGVPPPYLGNMIRQHYGTWINEDGPDVAGMLQLALKL